MASVVDICNLAMGHIGQDGLIASISPPDGSTEADYCARFYPIARDVMLALPPAWNFATRRRALAVTTNPVDHWEYAYMQPSDCINPLAVLLPESTDDTKTQDFDIETNDSGQIIIYTNVEDAVLKYVRSVTDTTKFSPLFVNALSILLGSYIAGPITKDIKLAEYLYKKAMFEGGRAGAVNANASQNQAYGARHTPGHIAVRR